MQREVEMLFRKNGILGMQLDSDNNRHVQMVMRLIEGGMAEKWCADHGYPPAAVLGAEIVAVNGYRVRAGETSQALHTHFYSGVLNEMNEMTSTIA